MLADPNNISHNLTAYVKGFSEDVREIFLQRFKLSEQIAKLDESNLLFQVVQKFAAVDLHPEVVPNHQMGLAFEELIRRFSEQSNEAAGEHFTPREVIRLMVNLLFVEDADVLTRPGIVKTLYDPTCGTGGMLATTTRGRMAESAESLKSAASALRPHKPFRERRAHQRISRARSSYASVGSACERRSTIVRPATV